MAEHLTRRNGRYFYRRRVPADLIEAYGKSEVQQALGTPDPKEAAKLARKVASKFDDLFDALRADMLKPESVADVDPLRVAAETWDPIKPLDRSTPENRQAVDAWEATIRDEATRDPVVARLLNEDAKQVRKLEKQRKHAAMLKATIREVLAEQRPVAAPPQLSANPTDTETHKPKQSATDSTASLMDVLRIWTETRKPVPDSIARMHTVVSRFFDATGRIPVRSITRQHVLSYQAYIATLGVTAASVRTLVAMLRALLEAAVHAGIIDTNPANGVRTEVTRSAKTARLPFTRADMNAIFAGPIYTERVRPKPAGGEAVHWLPILALYTGARLEELGQLSPVDIKEETYTDSHGHEQTVPVIYLTDEGEGQGLKNQASRRRVPVHTALIDAGFLQYVAKQTGERLFPALVADKFGRETSAFSRWFGAYLRNTCGISDKRKTFHSYRHAFKEIMREVGVQEDVSDALSGHTNGAVSRNYGSAFYPIRPLVEAMTKYRVPGVTLPV
jgi:integrase